MKSLILAVAIAAPMPEPVGETYWLMTLNPAIEAQVAWPVYPPGARAKCETMKSYGVAVVGLFGTGYVYCVSETKLMEIMGGEL